MGRFFFYKSHRTHSILTKWERGKGEEGRGKGYTIEFKTNHLHLLLTLLNVDILLQLKLVLLGK